MTSTRIAAVIWVLLVFFSMSSAQTPPPKEPPPLWDVQIGASFVGTNGNSDTASTGADFGAHRRPGLALRRDGNRGEHKDRR